MWTSVLAVVPVSVQVGGISELVETVWALPWFLLLQDLLLLWERLALFRGNADLRKRVISGGLVDSLKEVELLDWL